MKRLILLIILLVFSGCAGIGWQQSTSTISDDYTLETAGYRIRAFIALTGGTTGALDKLNSSTLNALDCAIVVTASSVYFYSWDAASALAEDSPDVIVPDNAPTTGRWILVTSVAAGYSSSPSDDPFVKLYETDGTSWWIGIDDTGNSIEFRTSETVGTDVEAELTESGYFTIQGNLIVVLDGLIGDDLIVLDDFNTGGTVIFSQAPQSLSGPGAINATTTITEYTSTGGAEALTIANGTEGQIKYIVHITDGGSGVLTGANLAGTSVTFTDDGDGCTLLYTNALWYAVGGTALFAP